jgi:hypothetical protein
MAVAGTEDIPETVKNRKIILICYSGINSAVAARHLLALGHDHMQSVSGGIETWMAKGDRPCSLSLCRLKTARGETKDFPWRASSLLEQWSACIAAFGFKPTYMLLSLAFILWIRNLFSPDVIALRWALIAFLTGEGLRLVISHSTRLLFCRTCTASRRSGIRVFGYALFLVLIVGWSLGDAKENALCLNNAAPASNIQMSPNQRPCSGVVFRHSGPCHAATPCVTNTQVMG